METNIHFHKCLFAKYREFENTAQSNWFYIISDSLNYKAHCKLITYKIKRYIVVLSNGSKSGKPVNKAQYIPTPVCRNKINLLNKATTENNKPFAF